MPGHDEAVASPAARNPDNRHFNRGGGDVMGKLKVQKNPKVKTANSQDIAAKEQKLEAWTTPLNPPLARAEAERSLTHPALIVPRMNRDATIRSSLRAFRG